VFLALLAAAPQALSGNALAFAQTYGPQHLPPVRDEDDPLVDAAGVVPGLIVELAYASPRNIAGRALYPADAKCLLRKSVAERLALAAHELRKKKLRLVARDCWRPPEAHEALWKAHPEPGSVADPARGSLHERGVAVDLGLASLDGHPAAVPTEFDAFGAEAAADAPLPPGPALENREALKQAMYAAGFRVNPKEWWHYARLWGWRWPPARKKK
jgi:D-alanyl-D-alanine dipeptidase